QAEDVIRDATVTGVQTCALPIWPKGARAAHGVRPDRVADAFQHPAERDDRQRQLPDRWRHWGGHALERESRGGVSGVSKPGGRADRKSTRLNSSHGSISYAVFCL